MAASQAEAEPKQVVEWQEAPLTKEAIDSFRQATRSSHSQNPLTFATRFRRTEFDLLDKLQVELPTLLHTDQTYEFFSDFEVGDQVLVRTWVAEMRERSVAQVSLRIITFESEFLVQGKKKASAETTFVVRKELK